MKIIFLDVDGVLNHSLSPEWNTDNVPYILDKECLNQLYRILLEAGEPNIVLTSTWRLYQDGVNALLKGISHPNIIGKTRSLGWGDKFPRKDEILDWLANVWPYAEGYAGKPITHMAVVDDDHDADLGDGSFFKTNFDDGGLTKEIADQIILHLTK